MRRALRGVAFFAAATALGLALTTSPALACPSCFSRAEGPLVDAARLGMGLLLAVVLAVQAAFVAFFLHLRRQGAKAADQALDVEWARLQRAKGHREALER